MATKRFTINEYAEYKGVSISTVRRYLRENRFKVVEEGGGRGNPLVFEVEVDSTEEVPFEEVYEEEKNTLSVEANSSDLSVQLVKVLTDQYERANERIEELQEENKRLFGEVSALRERVGIGTGESGSTVKKTRSRGDLTWFEWVALSIAVFAVVGVAVISFG